jgi:adenosylcobyric acid synthase
MKPKKNLMVVGTASSAGKSLMVTALCRIFLQDGFKVAPFKSQNMSLNSFITDEGLEMGRAQVVQAEACNILPKAVMNPILLKPSSDKKSQIIVEGKVLNNMDAAEYYQFKNSLNEIVRKNYKKLENDYDIIVLEGAGSPAEINLKENDIVNMGMAEIADAPVILVADIDRGGVFASIVGTIILLNENEKKRVKGIVINKFRGDEKILQPGIDQIEKMLNIPVLGVIPYLNINIEDEDSLTDKFKKENKKNEINIDVIRLPRISNFTDMDIFNLYEDVNLRYVTIPEEITDPDIIIIPGSKNTIEDLLLLKNNGLDKKIIEQQKNGKIIIGICGGFQILGKIIEDPYHIESELDKIEGLGLLDIQTIMLKEKTTKQISGNIINNDGLFSGLKNIQIEGYEIHMGASSGNDCKSGFMEIDGTLSGVIKNNIIGTYIHGIFDNVKFSRTFLNNIRKIKGLSAIDFEINYKKFKQKEYDKLAKSVRENLNMKKIYEILNCKED